MTDQPMTHGARRAVVILFALMALLEVSNLFFTSSEVGHLKAVVRTQVAQARVQAAQVRKLQRAVLASCAFAGDLGGAPFPAAAKVSKLGVSIVADSRAQWRHLGCPGHLAPAAPSFARWARFYHLPDS